MERRLIGREQEYGMRGVLSQNLDPKDIEELENSNFPDLREDQIRAYQVARIISAVAELKIPYIVSFDNHKDIWLANGSRIYLDFGALLETASPECRAGGLDLVIHEKASEMILNRAVKNLLDSKVFKELLLYKNNVGPSGLKNIFPEISYGHHQNYSYAEGKDREISEILKTFIPISLILSGSGHVYCDDKFNWRYLISPRATHILCDESVNTTKARPLINSRNRESRLHLISRDATRCELQTWLVDMATHLVMRLAEEGWKMPSGFALPFPINSLILSNNSFADYLNGPKGSWPLSGDIDIFKYNRVFLNAARQLNPLSEEEKDALDEWERILELLSEKALDNLVGELDWVTKWRLIKNQMKKHGYELSDFRAWKIDLSYHDISDDPNQSWFARLDALGYIRHLADSEDIRSAMENPPTDTRAFSRGRLIRLASEYGSLRADIRGIDWGFVKMIHSGAAGLMSYNFGTPNNPFFAVSPELEKLYIERYQILS